MTDARRVPAWADPGLGQTPGLGADRGHGGAELKRELDPGSAVVRFAYDGSDIDRDWSTLEERGFSWWAHELRQRVWADPAIDDDGIEVHRVFARTDLVRGVADAASAGRVIDALNGVSMGSALVLDAGAGTVSSVASMWVRAQTRDWVDRAFAGVAAIQVAQAEGTATLLAEMLGGEPDRTDHPASGHRPGARRDARPARPREGGG